MEPTPPVSGPQAWLWLLPVAQRSAECPRGRHGGKDVAMPKTAIVTRTDPGRFEIEAFIKKVYSLRYNASVDDFPARLIAFRGDDDELLCAAGLRTAEDGFFSEHYLDAPIEKILGDLSSQAVARDEIVEVSTLVSLAPNEVSQFIADMISFGKANGFSWSFFTATARLRRIVEKLGLCPIYLADADRERIVNFERWGNYYAEKPRVFAITSPPLAARLSAVHPPERHAISF